MQLHQIKSKAKKAKRKGRGGKKGTYCGRGVKGQKSRAGKRLKPIIREIIKRYPKLKGHRFQVVPKMELAINLAEIDKLYKHGETVNANTLAEKGLIPLAKARFFQVKILGKGFLRKPLLFENCQLSALAAAKIKKIKAVVK